MTHIFPIIFAIKNHINISAPLPERTKKNRPAVSEPVCNYVYFTIIHDFINIILQFAFDHELHLKYRNPECHMCLYEQHIQKDRQKVVYLNYNSDLAVS